MSHSALSPSCAFGFRSDIRHGIQFIDDGTLLYPSGHNVVLHHLESKTQRFIPGVVESDGMTAVAVAHSRRHCAIAERGETASIVVYDLQTLKRRKVLINVETGSKVIASLNFSRDGKLLVAQSGDPDWILAVWNWEKAKLVASVKSTTASQPVDRCVFIPSNQGVSVLSQHVYKQYRLTETSLKQQPHALTKKENGHYCCMEWSEDGLLVGSGDGEMLLCEGSEIAWSHRIESAAAVNAICLTSNGFAAGMGNGEVIIFSKESTGSYYLQEKRIPLLQEGIDSMILSPNGEQLLSIIETGQLYLVSFTTMEMRAETRSADHAFTVFHQGSVRGLSTCLRKTLVATCGIDRYIILWNYVSRSTELVKQFAEDCFSVSLHPSGTMIVAGFADKLRLMSILMDDFKLIKECSIRSCRECRFSNGGQYFAAAAGNTIFIYATYTCDVVGTLRGHSGKISSLYWSGDDAKLLSAGLDGAVYQWNVASQKRERENVLKGCNYSCVVATDDFENVLVVGSDSKLKELEDIQGSMQITKDVATDVRLTQIVMANGKGICDYDIGSM